MHFLIIAELHEKHRLELGNLTLTTMPLKTVKLFILAAAQCLKRLLVYVLRTGGWFMLLSTIILACGILVMVVDGPYEKVLYVLFVYANSFLSFFFLVIVFCLFMCKPIYESGCLHWCY